MNQLDTPLIKQHHKPLDLLAGVGCKFLFGMALGNARKGLRAYGSAALLFARQRTVAGARPLRSVRHAVGSLIAVCLMMASSITAARPLPPEMMANLINPWPPEGWSEVLDLSQVESSQPHRSQPVLRQGYFGQTLYRHIAGTTQYWTANILVQDRGSAGAAWRAVSSVRCSGRIYQGYRARECQRGNNRASTSTLYYQVDRFYVTIQLSGRGETSYPLFAVGAANPLPPRAVAVSPRRGSTRLPR